MYGLAIASGILTCLLIGEHLAKKQKYNINFYWSMVFWMILVGIIGARLYHVIDYWDYYSKNPITILYIHQGGLGIYGAFIGGFLSLQWSLKKHSMPKTDLFKWLDLASVVLPLGQAIGRWGNYFNRELFGLPTNLPWGIFIPDHLRPEAYLNYDVFHPLFFYEMFLNFGLFVILYRFYLKSALTKGPKRPFGTPTFLYMVGYGFIRFSLDFLRINPWTISGINVSQFISGIFILVGITGLFKLRRKRRPLP